MESWSGIVVAVIAVVVTSLGLLYFVASRRKAQASASHLQNAQQLEVEEHKEKVTLLFGTQTGTAERFAKQLKTEMQEKYGDKVAYNVVDIEDYKHEERLREEKLVIFMLATYGDGEPTDNAVTFYQWIIEASNEAKEDASRKVLSGVNFAIFGLGNKQYEHFCAVGRKVQDAMRELGANAIIRNGEGDDDEDIEADFDKWREELHSILEEQNLIQKPTVGKENGGIEVKVAGSLAAYDVQLHAEVSPASLPEAPQRNGDGTSVHSPFPATVIMHKELHTPQSDRSCLHVELDFTGSQISYEAGDHVGVVPQNEAEVVTRAANALGLDETTVFELQIPAGNPHQLSLPFSGLITLRDALAWHTDLLSPISKSAVQALSAYASGPDADALRTLLSPEGQADYKRWHAQSRNLLEVLEEFPSIKPPLGVFFGSIASRPQIRFYSISSSPKIQGYHVHVTCALVSHDTATGRAHRGVVSHQLLRSHCGMKLPAFIRKSSFRLPKDPTTPVIMIGPGTGLAPFRGFLQERAFMASQGTRLGPAHLFFGCRNSKHDYIYEAELADLQAQGGFTRLHTAFSREGSKKVYVQHRMEQHQSELWPLIEEGGHVYVCGEAKNMAKDVHKVLLRFAVRSELGSEKFMLQLSESGRYQKDVW